MQKLNSIQMLRAIAALMVVCFHFSIPLMLAQPSLLNTFFSHGWAGVDMFFVISGFIAAYTVKISDAGFDPARTYFIKRIIRIIPLYYLITILSIGHTPATFYEAFKSMLFIPIGGEGVDSYGPGYGGARVGQGWTLNYEIFFYLVVSASFFFGKYKWPFVTTIMLALIIIPPVIFQPPEGWGFQGFRFYMPYFSMMTNPIISEFLMGAFVFFIFTKMDSHINPLWILAIPCMIGMFVYNLYSPFLYQARFLTWGLPSALLVLCLLKIEKCQLMPDIKALTFIGNISFSIYLIHDGANSLIRKIIKIIAGPHIFDNLQTRCLSFVIALIVTLLISKLTYEFIEKKQGFRLRKLLLKPGH
ncbi:acyltransferase family protein [Yokenella regensburgei]|uniref:acyltransferase family protein n=1 Tax=Yokenella regensburgei TaxID=158877 RepID=UPI003ED8B9B4